jgi:hypothetical protein
MAVDWLRKQFRFGGGVAVPVADSATATTVTDEQAANRLLKATGAHTADRSLNLPLENGADWIVRNDTTGGFTLSVGGATGDRVDVPPGEVRYLICDGTDFASEAEVAVSAASSGYELASPGTGDGTRDGFFTGTTTNATVTEIGSIPVPSSNWTGLAQVIVSVLGQKDGDALACSFFLTRGDYYVDNGEFFLLGTLDEAPNAGNVATTAATIDIAGSPPLDELQIRVTGIAAQTWKWRATYSITFASN